MGPPIDIHGKGELMGEKCKCCEWIPTATSFDLTEACNLACDYCFTHSCHKPRRADEGLLTRLIAWWIDQTLPQNKQNHQISWWGGEPLLEWKMLQRLTKYANELMLRKGHDPNRFEFGGTTNGLLYTPDKVEWCLENRCLMLISLDGVQPAHDAHRKFPDGRGSFNKVYKRVKDAMKVAPQTKVRTSIAADTVQYLFDTAVMVVEDLGCKDFAFSPVYEGNWDQAALETLAEQYDKMVDYLVKSHQDGRPLIFKHLNDQAVSQAKGKFFKANPCGAGNGYTGFSIDGYGFPCHRFNKHSLTPEQRARSKAVICRPIGDTWEWCNEEFRRTMCFKTQSLTKCESCEIFDCSHCNGNCYAVNFDMTGDVRTPPQSVCDIAKILTNAGNKFAREAKELNLTNVRSSFGENMTDENKPAFAQAQCVCYNLCYAEGTRYEIIGKDPRNDITCLCYNSGYDLIDMPSRTRPVAVHELEQKTVHMTLEALLLSPNIPEMEREMIKKSLQILKKEHLNDGRNDGN
jgi:uncharacterized protein